MSSPEMRRTGTDADVSLTVDTVTGVLQAVVLEDRTVTLRQPDSLW